jgi:hypothetical protein
VSNFDTSNINKCKQEFVLAEDHMNTFFTKKNIVVNHINLIVAPFLFAFIGEKHVYRYLTFLTSSRLLLSLEKCRSYGLDKPTQLMTDH